MRPYFRGSPSLGRFAVIVTAVLATAMLATVFSSTNTSAAGTIPLTVYGWVLDQAGYPLEGADVSVSVTTGGTGSDTTDSDGRYTVDIPIGEWDLGDTVTVTAEYNSILSDPNTTVIDQDMYDFGLAEVWVQYTFEIPEFGSFFGVVLVTVALGATAIFLARKRRE